MIYSIAGGSLPTPLSTCTDSWLSTLDFGSPAVVALLTAIAAWVAYRTPGISRAAASTSAVEPDSGPQLLEPPGSSE